MFVQKERSVATCSLLSLVDQRRQKRLSQRTRKLLFETVVFSLFPQFVNSPSLHISIRGGPSTFSKNILMHSCLSWFDLHTTDHGCQPPQDAHKNNVSRFCVADQSRRIIDLRRHRPKSNLLLPPKIVPLDQIIHMLPHTQ